MLATLSRTLFCRLLAAFIVVLVVSPYSEPFATTNGTDFGGSGAVDVGGSSKPKAPTQEDVLVPPPSVVAALDLSPIDVGPVARTAAHDHPPRQHTILRL
jgi:hypothetical protein